MSDWKKLWRIGIDRHSVSYPIPQHPSPRQYLNTSPQPTVICVAGGEEREEGKWPFATTNASPPRNFLSFEKRKNFRLSDEVNRGVLLSVCRIVVEFLDGFCVIFFLVYGMVGISYKIFCLYGHSWSFVF